RRCSLKRRPARTEMVHLRLKLKIGLLLAATMASVVAVNAVDQPAFASDPSFILNWNTSLCLQPVPDPFQNITDNGVRIAQVSCGFTLSEQKWQPLQVGTSGGRAYYYLINQRSGKCLDVTDANTSDRATIQQFDCNGGGSEMWFVKPANVPDGVFPRAQYINL